MVEEPIALELKMNDVALVVQHLVRKHLVSNKGATALLEAASEIELPPPPANEPQRKEAAVDVDQLLLKWMSMWGSWDWKEDSALVSSILQRFAPRSPTKMMSPAKKSLAAKLR